MCHKIKHKVPFIIESKYPVHSDREDEGGYINLLLKFIYNFYTDKKKLSI